VSHLEDTGQARVSVPEDREQQARQRQLAQQLMDTASCAIRMAWKLDPTLAGIMPAVAATAADEPLPTAHRIMPGA